MVVVIAATGLCLADVMLEVDKASAMPTLYPEAVLAALHQPAGAATRSFLAIEDWQRRLRVVTIEPNPRVIVLSKALWGPSTTPGRKKAAMVAPVRGRRAGLHNERVQERAEQGARRTMRVRVRFGSDNRVEQRDRLCMSVIAGRRAPAGSSRCTRVIGPPILSNEHEVDDPFMDE